MAIVGGDREWLTTNELGSFALGTVDRVPHRKYHGLLTARDAGRGEPWNVVADVAERFDVAGEVYLLHSYDYGGVVEPQGFRHLTAFHHRPHPTFIYRLGPITVERQVRLAPERDQVELHYRVTGVPGPVRVSLRTWLRCRPWHGLTAENPTLNGAIDELAPGHVRLTPYRGMPTVEAAVTGATAAYVTDGIWLRGVHYATERARGYDHVEDFYSPGDHLFTITTDVTVCLTVGLGPLVPARPLVLAVRARSAEDVEEELAHASTQFFLHYRDGSDGVIAGYPWFQEWGRDTLIALPGLTLATGRWDRAEAIITSVAGRRVRGLVPNILAVGEVPANLNSVDASLLFVRAVQWLGGARGAAVVESLMPAVCEILEAIADRADPRVRIDDTLGLWLEPGPWALTWMDAVYEGRPITPRHGFAVEIDALMLNAAIFACEWAESARPRFAEAWRRRLRGARQAFFERYWLEAEGHLADRHDGVAPDRSLRPNQLWALALPHRAVAKARGAAVLRAVRESLWTPAGLRTLAPHDPAYRGRYRGDGRARDEAYHQGTVWPWLLGLYADAVANVAGRGRVQAALAENRAFFARHLEDEGCIGQVSEVFDGDAPHAAGGTPAQAWSVAELARTWRLGRS